MGVGAGAKPRKVPAAGGGGKVEQRRRETGGSGAAGRCRQRGNGELFKGGDGERAAARASEWTSRVRSMRCVISRPWRGPTWDDWRYQMIRLVPRRHGNKGAELQMQ